MTTNSARSCAPTETWTVLTVMTLILTNARHAEMGSSSAQITVNVTTVRCRTVISVMEMALAKNVTRDFSSKRMERNAQLSAPPKTGTVETVSRMTRPPAWSAATTASISTSTRNVSVSTELILP